MEYKLFSCDVCGLDRIGERFDGEILVGNGSRQNYNEVCEACVQKTLNYVQTLRTTEARKQVSSSSNVSVI